MNASRPPVIDYEGSDYQATFWDQGGRAYEDQAEAVALRRLLPPAGRLLLEIGAGAGRNTRRYGGFTRIVLLDYSLSQLQLARQRLGAGDRYVYVAADAYRLPLAPAQFDAVTMIRTLHHMADVPAALAQVRQVLQLGSAFILEYANKLNLKAISRYLLRRQSWSPFDHAPVEFAALNFDFHPAAMRAWLGASGFAVERQLTVSHFRLGLFKRRLPLRLLVAADSLAQLTGDWWQLAPSVFVKARAVRREAGDQGMAIGEQGLAISEQRPGNADQRLGTGERGLAIIFRCPACRHFPLAEDAGYLACPACTRQWPGRDGIYDLRDPV